MRDFWTYNEKCRDCGHVDSKDFFTVRPINNHGEVDAFCDKCLAKYPKEHPQEWRREDHPDAFGVVTWSDGSKSFIDDDGVLRDVETDAQPVDYLAAAKESFKATCLACLVGGIAFGFYLATVIQGGVK